MASSPTYVWPAHTTVTTANKEIIPFDAGLSEFAVVNIGAAKAYATQGGLVAAPVGDGSVPLEAGGGSWSTDLVQPGAVSAIADAATKLSVFFRTTTSYNVAARAGADAYVARIASAGVTLTTDQANAHRQLFTRLYESGALQTLGCFYNLRGPSATAFLNLCNISDAFATESGTITKTNWRNVSFDGSTSYVDTRFRFKDAAGAADHSILAYPGDATLQGSTRCAGGDSNITFTANRTATTIAGRSLSNDLMTPGGFTAGPGLVSMSVADPAKATFRQKKTVSVDVARTNTGTLLDRSILIGARNNAGTGGTGPTTAPSTGTYYLGPLMCFGAGRHLTQAMHNEISDAMDEFIATTGAFA